MKSSVGAMRQEFAADLVGARQAWGTLSPTGRRAKEESERQAREAQLAQQKARAEAQLRARSEVELRAREETEKTNKSPPQLWGKRRTRNNGLIHRPRIKGRRCLSDGKSYRNGRGNLLFLWRHRERPIRDHVLGFKVLRLRR